MSTVLNDPTATAPAVTSSPPGPALLDVAALTIEYDTPRGPFTAVDGFALEMSPGERVAVVGESGSGKTTACMAVAGFLGPDARVQADRLSFAGRDLRDRRTGVLPQRVPGIAVVFQDAMSSLDPVWTVGSQLRAVIRNNEELGRAAVRARAAEWLRRVGLHDTDRVLAARPYELSGGMRQRVMIALALSARPRLLIADEPTSALDATLSRELMALMVDLADELGTGMLVVSHDIQLCQEFTDRTLVMHRGRVVEEGRSATLAQTATHPYTQGLISCIPTLDTAMLDRMPTMAPSPRVHVETAGAA